MWFCEQWDLAGISGIFPSCTISQSSATSPCLVHASHTGMSYRSFPPILAPFLSSLSSSVLSILPPCLHSLVWVPALPFMVWVLTHSPLCDVDAHPFRIPHETSAELCYCQLYDLACCIDGTPMQPHVTVKFWVDIQAPGGGRLIHKESKRRWNVFFMQNQGQNHRTHDWCSLSLRNTSPVLRSP